MGNKFICMTKKDIRESGKNGIGSRSKRMERSKRRSLLEEELLHRQALSMAIQQHQLSQRFEGSMSRRIGSTSSRRRNDLPDQLANSKQPPEFLENIKTKKFVLVHGEGFGAWCWYKTIALLEETGLVPTALDLTGSGIHLTDTNNVTTLVDYSKPLIDYLEKLPEDEKLGSAELFTPESKFLIYGNGKDKPATCIMFEKEQMQGLYFNQSPTKDVALAMVSMRPIPLGPMMDKLSLTPEKYGTSRRFYIQTLDDHALSPDVQEKLVRVNPPEGVFKIKGSDHAPFFSKPQSLHKILVEIAQIP
ncbi:putative methylesterase 14, chloroplastic isoform X2 [Lycium barbarum]|uniref:putative methylesterase 14, chloroplastic isoform X2 n=1 Tax=Lycium barbarum TaxID=112863 RepID=UPI00293EDC76|nr:putative methylesterase 14, chloroplastic isoform X2 [Lycium barbarum]